MEGVQFNFFVPACRFLVVLVNFAGKLILPSAAGLCLSRGRGSVGLSGDVCSLSMVTLALLLCLHYQLYGN